MTDNINLPVVWQEIKKPNIVGMYFVAVRYPTGFGSYDFVLWDGNVWDLNYKAEIVGWVTLNDILNIVKAGWPKGDENFYNNFDEFYKKHRKNVDDGDDFIEI